MARQQAVDELRPNVDFREDLAVLAAETRGRPHRALAAWAARRRDWIRTRVAFTLAPAARSRSRSPCWRSRTDRRSWLFFWLIVEAAIAIVWRAVRTGAAGIETPDRDLGLLAGLLARIEIERFTSPRLAALRHRCSRTACCRRSGSRSCGAWCRGSTRPTTCCSRRSPTRCMLPQQLAVAIDRWHRDYGPAVDDGCARSASSKRSRRWRPTRSSIRAIRFRARRRGAALRRAGARRTRSLPDGRRGPNDVRLGGGAPHVIVISGSNMSGKSTLLRSVGVNVVLALAGAPVRAGRAAPVAAGDRRDAAKSRTRSQAGHSRFYAEILRIRRSSSGARAGAAAVSARRDPARHEFVRSADRRRGDRPGAGGARRDRPGHDPRPGADRTAVAPRRAAVNMHFEDRLENGRMVFDYRMRPGVVEHSNALALMRAIGLDV